MSEDTAVGSGSQEHGPVRGKISLDRIGVEGQGTEYQRSTPSGLNECTNVLTHSIIPEQRGRTIASTLLEVGVFALSTAKRESVAATLQGEGVTPEAVSALWRFIRDSEPEATMARRYMAAILTDADKRKDAFVGIRSMSATEEEHGTHQRGFPCPYWTCTCSVCDRARASGKPNEGPRPDFLFDGVAPPRERIQREWPKRSRLQPSHDEDVAKLTQLVAACKAFLEAKRGIPGYLVSEVIRLKHVWRQVDVPAQVIAMEKRLPKNPQTAT